VLQALVDNGRSPIAVLTQPDRPAGRGKRLTTGPVKQFSAAHNIPVLQPATLCDDEIVQTLRDLRADVMIVAAYGLILPQYVLDVPAHGCLNIHASLLPRWRGAAPVQAAILANDAATGISLMQMTAGLDCGPVLATRQIDIGGNETAGELHDRLAALGGELICENLMSILGGEVEAQKQDESAATYARKIRTPDAELDWQLSADELQRRVRAYNPVPGAFFFAGEERIKCWRATAVTGIDARAGTVVEFNANNIVVACDNGGLRLDSLQRPGKQRISADVLVAQIDLRDQSLSG